MAVSINWQGKAPSTNSFGLSCEDAYDKKNWRIKGATSEPRLPKKMAVKTVCVSF